MKPAAPAVVWALDAFDRRLEPASAAPIAVAFSGGGDSLAVLLATKAWADRAGRRVVVLTVDHGLQPQSRDWVRFAETIARRIGADFEPLTWGRGKPATGISAAARAARHRLIADAARRHGARVVVFGHTADDLAEAALMRAEGSSVGAPREWAPSPVWPEGRGVFLLRPLLGLGRAAIRERLTAAGETWIDDPANENPESLRARVRTTRGLLLLGGRERRSPLAIASAAQRASALSTVAAKRTDEGSHRPIREVSTTQLSGRCDPSSGAARHLLPQGEKAFDRAAGHLLLDRSFFRAATDDFRTRVLGAALTCAGGGDRPPRRDRLAALAERLAGHGDVTATLAGAKLVADAGQVLIARNPGEAARGGLAPITLTPGQTAVWDGRFEIAAGGAPVTIQPLAGHARALDAPARAALRALPAAARGALPSYADPVAGRVCPILAQDGSLRVRSLVAARFAAATGMISKEPAA